MGIPEGYILVRQSDYEEVLNRLTSLENVVKEQQSYIQELEERLSKHSRNSHKPPSSDGYSKKIQNNREKSQRKPGGQPGRKGTTLSMVENPDKVIEHKVANCAHCGLNLSETPVQQYHRGQVFDIPPIQVQVTEHRAEVKQCPSCSKETVATCPVSFSAQYGEGIKSLSVYLNQYQMLPYFRIREMFRDLFGCTISAAVIQQSNQKCYTNLQQTEAALKSLLTSSSLIHADETGVRCESKTQWVHVHSTADHTLYVIDGHRGREAMDRIGVLPEYTGVCVHDRWASYEKYQQCTHAYCNAHLLRDLKAEQEKGKPYAEELQKLLCEANELSKEGTPAMTAVKAIEKRYDQIITKALKNEPAPVRVKGKRGKIAKGKTLNLLECFRDKKTEIMRFLYNKDVPFDNNLAERDLRMVELKQKISGCFRTQTGAEVFCRVRSYISTVKKQNGKVWQELKLALQQPEFQPLWVRRGE